MTLLMIIGLLLGGDKVTIAGADVRAVVMKYLQEQMPVIGSGTEFSFRTEPADVSIPAGEYRLRVAPHQPVRKGHSVIPVEVIRNGAVDRIVLCSVLVRTFDDVYVAVRPFQKHEMLDPSILVVKRIETTELDDALTASMPLEGLRTKRMVAGNSIIRTSSVETIPAIRRDQMVSVMVRSGSLTVGAAGVAKEDGHIGDTILVQRLKSRETFRAKVVSNQIVEVEIQ